MIREILLQFFVALLIMAILNPTVDKLARRKIPRGAIVLGMYVIFFVIVSFAVSAVVPPLLDQTTSFASNLPHYISNLGVTPIFSEQIMQELVSQLAQLPSHIAKFTISLFSNLLAIVAVLVFAFYLLTQRDVLENQLGNLLSETKKNKVVGIIDKIENKLGNWARGQFTLMLVVGSANYVGLTLLGIPFALPLSILAGVLEIVPYLGPIIAAIPAVLIGFGISPITGFAVAALAFLIQQLENYLFVPKIMQKSAGVDPVITLLSLAIGFKIAGVVGLLVSIPLFLTFEVLVKEYLRSVRIK